MCKKTSLLYISMLLCIIFMLAACNAAGKESEPAQVGFVKKESIVGIYDADKTNQSALLSGLIATKLEESGQRVQMYDDLAALPKTGLHALCVCTKEGQSIKNTVESKLSNKTKIFFIGDAAMENGLGIEEKAYGIAAVEAIHSDMLERKQVPGMLVMAAQGASRHKEVQDGFIKQAGQYGYAAEEMCFELGETFYTWLKEQAAQKPVGVLALDTKTAAHIAQFSIENGLTDDISIIALGAEEQTYKYLRLCAISGILMEDPHTLAEAVVKIIVNEAETFLIQPLLLTRKNVDMPEYRDL